MANWSTLDRDLLVEIASRISLHEDFIAFGCVCTSWREVAIKEKFKIRIPHIPLLMLAPKQGNNLRGFFSLSRGMTHHVIQPESIGKRCYSSQGWLITISQDLSMNLLHPFTSIQIKLPHIKTIHHWQCLATPKMYSNFIHKVLLTASPSHTSEYVVIIIFGCKSSLAFCHPGDNSWTIIKGQVAAYFDVAYYKERLYAADCRGRVRVCDIRGSSPYVAETVTIMPEGLLRGCSVIECLYLVESSGALLVVSRKGVETRPVEEGSSKYTYGTTDFQVFVVDLSTGEWKEVKSLGNRALFLGHNSSVSFEASNELSGCRADCIYFTDDCKESYFSTRRGGGKDMGIYNLLDESFEPHFKGKSFSRLTPPMWVEYK